MRKVTRSSLKALQTTLPFGSKQLIFSNRNSSLNNYPAPLTNNNNNKMMKNLFAVKYYSTPTLLADNNTTPTLDPTPPTTTLYPTLFENWTKEEVCSLLCSAKGKGGAGLTVEEAKSFYDAGFKGTSVANIISSIKEDGKKHAVDDCLKSFPIVPRDTMVSVVNWVDNLLKTRLYHLWSADQVKEQLCKPIDEGGVGLSVDDVKPLFDAGFKGNVLANIIENIKMRDVKYAIDQLERTYNKSNIPELSNTCQIVVFWVNNSSIAKTITIESFVDFKDFSIHIYSMLNVIPQAFLQSKQQWSTAIENAKQDQKSKLGNLYREPLLPDEFSSFSIDSKKMWTYHFNDLCIPKDKGKDLNELLSSNASVGRGGEFGLAIIPFVDLSTSGKTYTIFHLANSKPINGYKHFFVVNCVPGTQIHKNLITAADRYPSTQLMVSLFAFNINVTIKTLVEKVPSITPIDFLKFIRNGGDALLSNMYTKLIMDSGSTDPDTLSNLLLESNKQLTAKLKEHHGIKVVFSFDEAHQLLEYGKDRVKLSDGKMGSLFHAVYKEICQYNNVVFLGTTFNLSQAVLNASNEGRSLMNPVIGSLAPWFLSDVDKILCHMFNVDKVKQEQIGEYNMLCYLLSGSPENVTIFHRSLLNQFKNIPMRKQMDELSLLRIGLQNVINFKEERSKKRINEYLSDTSLMDRTTHLFRLLFNMECKFYEPDIKKLDEKLQYTYSQAFIEKTIAHVVKKADKSNVFDIVDPIYAKAYFKTALTELKENLWKFMVNEFKANGADFEMFMVILLLHEAERLNGQSIAKSPLFPMNESKLDDWNINATTFISDRHLSKKVIQTNKEIPGIWSAQLYYEYFMDTFVKPDNNMGPDGMFYLKNKFTEEYMLATCAMTLVSDPISDKYQPNKAINMFRTLFVSNIGTEKTGRTNTLGIKVLSNKESGLGWIVAPNMDVNAFSETNLKKQYSSLNSQIPIGAAFSSLQDGSLKLIFTGAKEIEACMNCYRNEKYYKSMLGVWNKFNQNCQKNIKGKKLKKIKK